MEVSKIYPIAYDKKHFVVMSNDIIKGKQEMSLQQARIIRLLITQVVKQDKDLKTYTCRIHDLAEFLEIATSNLYRDVRQLCSDLLKLQVKIGTGNPREPWRIFQWLQLAQYDGNGNITLMLSNQIAPFVLELDKYFTQYQQANILTMQSYYAIRLYELLKMQYGINQYTSNFNFTIDELREYFCCENKYKAFKDFRVRVIEIAVNEINSKTDLLVTPTYLKTGRTITNIDFEVHYQFKKQLYGHVNIGG